jgi:hypothetical protein
VPWRPSDATRLLLVEVTGATAVIGGWLGAADTSDLAHQLGWVTVAVVGLVIASTGNTLWLLAGRRNVGLRLQTALAERDARPRGLGSAPAAPTQQSCLVAVPKGSRYHRQDCVLVIGKTTTTRAVEEHLAQGLRACEVCDPELPG